ncbi:hypothetical protein ACGFIW_01155 [Micromonospora sp. NPDC048935]|uniref:hypothetical protein n=1 Tax=Micromonospora sp. NPDC048935 TaxID=3364262 RepID=UPI00371C9846
MSQFTPTTGDGDLINWSSYTAVAEARKGIMLLGVSAQEAERFAFMAVDAITHAGLLPAEHHWPLLKLSKPETEALIHGALFWHVGEGAMEGEKYEALQTALAKVFPKDETKAAA